ncbi:MAG: ornithine cyclodeaminase family protein [Gemmataceae bacterium]|nr:ornithine cyclodeaminase family protein [Gemmataceae bacterium]
METLLINEEEVVRLLSMDRAINAVEGAFKKLGLEEASNIPRARAVTDHAQIHVMGASHKTASAMGAKIYATSRKNPAQFFVTLFDGKNARLLALLQADHLGRIRTGAASAVATRLLARSDADSLGVLGAGRQAKTQIQAISLVRSLRLVRLWSRSMDRASALAAELKQEGFTPPIEVQAQPLDAVRGMDILITATSATDPFVEADWLEPGQHINAIGSNYLGRAELQPKAVCRCDLIVVDHRDQAKLESGDLEKPLEDKLIHWAAIRDLGPLMVGRYPGRENPHQITLFKSNGLAIQDVACAKVVHDLARDQGLGKVVSW